MLSNIFFKQGVKDSIPLLFGLIPFAILTGVSAIQSGMSPFTAQMSSILLMSGASQIAAASLMISGAAPLIVILTHIAINFRYAIYSAGLAQLKLKYSPFSKALAANMLIDQTFVLAFLKSQSGMLSPKEKTAYYFGTAIPMWCIWQLGTALGIFAGPFIPGSWHLEYAIVICFVTLLIPMIKTKSILVATVFAGLTSAFTYTWPYNLGFLFSMLVGVLCGGLFRALVSVKQQKEVYENE